MSTLKVFEFVLAGFNGATDETDHLIKWVQANNLEAAKEKASQAGYDWTQAHEIDVPDMHPDDIDIN